MCKVIISNTVRRKIIDIRTYLVVELKFSEEAACKRADRMKIFLASLAAPADYALCRFKKWRELGYRYAVFEKSWVFAYEVFDNGVIVRDMSHAATLAE